MSESLPWDSCKHTTFACSGSLPRKPLLRARKAGSWWKRALAFQVAKRMAWLPLLARSEEASHSLHSIPDEVGPSALNLSRMSCLLVPRSRTIGAFHVMEKSSFGFASTFAMGFQSMETSPDLLPLVVVDVHADDDVGHRTMKSLCGELGPDLLHVLVKRGEDLDHPARGGASLRVGLPSTSREATKIQ